jgi:flagellar assembly factor FliW
MEINSKIFGKVEFVEENIVHLKEGLIGIPDKKNFILIEKEDFQPFSYLQSVDDGNFILVVINPLLVKKEYTYDIYQDDLASIGLTRNDPDSLSLLGIVIMSDKIENVTVNLKAPIAVNIHTKQAKQVILLNDDYSIEEPLIQVPSPGPGDVKAAENK